MSGLCISVKRVWTLAWVLVSGGWCFLILFSLHAITDLLAWIRFAFPVVVIGMNSIAAYVMSWVLPEFIKSRLDCHLGADFKNCFGEEFSTLVSGGVVLMVIWAILFWMYRRRLFLKV